MTNTGMMPRLADIAGGATDTTTYERLATLYSGGVAMTASERHRHDSVAALLRSAAAAGNEQGGKA